MFIVMSRDGTKIISESRDGIIKIWQLEDGELINSINSEARAVSF